MNNVSSQTIQTDIKNIIGSVSSAANKYWGHVWSYTEKVPSYLQNPIYAYTALVAANFVAFELGMRSTKVFQYFFPIPEESLETIDEESIFTKKRVVELTSSLIGFGTIGGCLTLFIEGTKLPLKTPVIMGVSAAILIPRGYYYYNYETLHNGE